MTLVWGDTPPPTALNTLQNHVSQLRRVLGTLLRIPITRDHTAGAIQVIATGLPGIDGFSFADRDTILAALDLPLPQPSRPHPHRRPPPDRTHRRGRALKSHRDRGVWIRARGD
jgi:hypothetical protein